MDIAMTHKALQAFCFYSECKLNFKTFRDLYEYHEKCVRWYPEREWPNVQNLRRIAEKTNTAEARVFKGLYDSLKDTGVLTFKFVESDGPVWYELIT